MASAISSAAHDDSCSLVGDRSRRDHDARSERNVVVPMLPTQLPCQASGENERHTGLSLTVRTTLSVSHVLYSASSVVALSTQVVQQCVADYRDALLLGRECEAQGSSCQMSYVTLLEKLCHWDQRRHECGCESATTESLPGEEPSHSPREDVLLGDPSVAARLMLSAQPRYVRALLDLRLLAQHILIPYDVLRHHHQWLFIGEDVRVTLHDRLRRHRVVMQQSGRPGADALSSLQLEQLWNDLWSTLGAAWRQRERLLGAYQHVHGSKALGALSLCSSMATRMPPKVHASPHQRDRYEAQKSTPRRHPHADDVLSAFFLDAGHVPVAAHQDSGSDATGRAVEPGNGMERYARLSFPLPYEENDTCAFGPFTPARIGITRTRRFAFRDPLAAVWRALRLLPPAEDRELPVWLPKSMACATLHSMDEEAGYPRVVSPSPRTSAGLGGNSVDTPQPALKTAPFFDCTTSDMIESAAAPYMSPEVFLWSCQSGPTHGAPWHCFSDDVWNAAVVWVEAALSGFDVHDPGTCHLAQLTQWESSGGGGSPKQQLPLGSGPRSTRCASVFADTVAQLVEGHHVQVQAAHNFLYATLRCFRHAMMQWTEDVGQCRWDAADPAPSISPERLASEWLGFLHAVYRLEFVTGILRRVVELGLGWQRAERWRSFSSAHGESEVITGDGDAVNERRFAPTKSQDPQVSRADGGGRSTGIHDPFDSGGISGRVSRQTTHERLLNILSTPLLPLFTGAPPAGTNLKPDGEEGSGTISLGLDHSRNSSSGMWQCLRHWQGWMRRLSILDGGSKSNVEAKQSTAFIEMVRLARRAIVAGVDREPITLPCHGDTHLFVAGTGERSTLSSSQEDKRQGELYHFSMQHPFIRGVLQRGQLPVFAAMAMTRLPTITAQTGPSDEQQIGSHMISEASCQPSQGAAPPCTLASPLLSTPSVFLGQSTVRLLIAQDERLLADEFNARAHPVVSSPIGKPRCGVATGSLQSLTGDHRLRLARQRMLNRQPSCQHSLTHGTMLHTLSGSVKEIMRPHDLNFDEQLEVVRALRHLLLQPLPSGAAPSKTNRPSSPALAMSSNTFEGRYASPLGVRATRVSTYLRHLQKQRHMALVPVPGTLRGEVWGALLEVPPAKQRELIFSEINTALGTSSDRQIAVDVPRCHPYHPLLSSEEGHSKLHRIIKAWLQMNPGAVYWQGLDSLSAVLLSVSYHDEPLVALQLLRLTQHTQPREWANESDPEGAMCGETRRTTARLVSAPTPPCPPLHNRCSMEQQLHQLSILLRYCDPRLASHLIEVAECPPPLFAISWFLTLFAHGLPTRRIYLLWDFLLVYGIAYPHCYTCLCCAVLMQHRQQLIGMSTTECLSVLCGALDFHVTNAITEASRLVSSIPACVGCRPYDEDDTRWGGVVHHGMVAFMDVHTIVQAIERGGGRERKQNLKGNWGTEETSATNRELEESCSVGDDDSNWYDSGVCIIDLRDDSTAAGGGPLTERVLGSLHFPLSCPSTEDSDALHDFHRNVVDVAAQIGKQVANPVMAAVPPRQISGRGRNETPRPVDGVDGLSVGDVVGNELAVGESTPFASAPLPVPHVVLVTDGCGYRCQESSLRRADVQVAQPLALQLCRIGVHHVSILLGGVERLKEEAPQLLIPSLSKAK